MSDKLKPCPFCGSNPTERVDFYGCTIYACPQCDYELYPTQWNTRHEPKHETVEQWEARTGKTYPDDGPVWCMMSYNQRMVKVKPYYELIEYGKVDSINNCIIANHHGKPETLNGE